MKAFSVLLVFTAATLASAQSQCVPVAAKIPSCGVSCISSAASYAGCSQTDFACQCSSSQSSVIQSAALDCIVNACGAVTGLQVSSSALAVCSCVKTAAPALASPTSGNPVTTPKADTTSTPKSTTTGSMGSVAGYGGPNLVASTTAPVAAVTAGAQTIGAMGGVLGGVLAVVAAF